MEDFYGLCGEKALQAELEKTFMEKLIHAAVKCGIADKKARGQFCGGGYLLFRQQTQCNGTLQGN